jgi:hypothetical protein
VPNVFDAAASCKHFSENVVSEIGDAFGVEAGFGAAPASGALAVMSRHCLSTP